MKAFVILCTELLGGGDNIERVYLDKLKCIEATAELSSIAEENPLIDKRLDPYYYYIELEISE